MSTNVKQTGCFHLQGRTVEVSSLKIVIFYSCKTWIPTSLLPVSEHTSYEGLIAKNWCVPLICICLFKSAQWVSVVHAWSDCAYGPRNSRTRFRAAGRPVVLPPVRPRTPLCQRTRANGWFPSPFCFGNFFGFSYQTDEFCVTCASFQYRVSCVRLCTTICILCQ